MDTQEGVAKKKEFYKRWWFWIIIGVVVLLAIGASNSSSSGAGGADNTAPSVGPTAPTTTNSAGRGGPASTFGDGTFIVNTDIQSGTYKSSGGEYCTYERLSGFGGTTGDIIAIGNPNGSAIVTIAATDKGFTSSGCGTWTKISVNSDTQAKTSPAPAAASQLAPSDTSSAHLFKTPSGALVDANGNVVLTAEQVQAFEALGQNLPQFEANYEATLNNTSTIDQVYQNSRGSQ